MDDQRFISEAGPRVERHLRACLIRASLIRFVWNRPVQLAERGLEGLN